MVVVQALYLTYHKWKNIYFGGTFMYEINGLGKRIAAFRKLQGITQEELAARLNITAQAVSKWENELSLPDISILPYLAGELNTTMDKLFGDEGILKSGASLPSFPETKNGILKLVHTVRDVACYSEKEVDTTNGDSVLFKDGSSANLKQLKIINKGPGDICFDFMDERFIEDFIDPTKTELVNFFDDIQSIEVGVNEADFQLIRSDDHRTGVKATGAPLFINGLKVLQKGDTLSIHCDHENRRNGGSGSSNKIIVTFGCDRGKNLQAGINGAGDVEVRIPFESGQASVNGSGDITVTEIGELKASINGSGDICAARVGNLSIAINGSGDFTTKEVFGSFHSTINGSGAVELGTGELERFESAIYGSGDIGAKGVSTRTANLSITGSGHIIIGRVIEESIEKHCKGSVIEVIKRG